MSDHLNVLKTYKIYIGGAFPRTESGRYYKVFDENKDLLANACLCSRKDVRDAVQSARSAFKGWNSRSAYNRGQILYRIAEMLEDRREQFQRDLVKIGFKAAEAEADLNASIDRLIYYAGWTDKYQQVFGTINPVASPHFNFSMMEPMGVCAIIAPEQSPLLGLISLLAPALAGGNTTVILASEAYPLPAITFAEVLNSSDVQAGVVNILTGNRDELVEHMAGHMDINAIVYTDIKDQNTIKLIEERSTDSMKRVVKRNITDWYDIGSQNPYLITDLQEVKTTWHPIGY